MSDGRRTDVPRVDGFDRSVDELCMALSDSRRRIAVRCVARADHSLPLSALVDRIAAEESGTVDRRTVRTSLVQTHLPTLAAVDVVAHDDDRGIVSERPGIAAALALLEPAAPGRGSV